MHDTEQRPWERPKERVRVRLCREGWRGVSGKRLAVSLLAARAPWNPPGPGGHRVVAELFSHPTLGVRRKPSP